MTDRTPSPAPGGTATLGSRRVPRIGYGAMQLERLSSDPEAAVALVRRAVSRGVTHFDTAHFYGDGFVNEILRRALADNDAAIVATKVGADPNPGGPVRLRPAQRPHELRASVEANLRQLGRERLDLVYLRRVDTPPGIVATGDQIVPIDDQLAAMTAVRDEGKIDAIGLSAVTLDRLRAALPAGIAAVQNEYSLVSRGDEQLLAICQAEQIAWVPFFPLGGAFPGRRKVVDEPAVQAAGSQLGATAAQVGLAWLLQHAPNILLVPGTATEAHLDHNLAAGDIQLGVEAVAALDAAQ